MCSVLLLRPVFLVSNTPKNLLLRLTSGSSPPVLSSGSFGVSGLHPSLPAIWADFCACEGERPGCGPLPAAGPVQCCFARTLAALYLVMAAPRFINSRPAVRGFVSGLSTLRRRSARLTPTVLIAPASRKSLELRTCGASGFAGFPPDRICLPFRVFFWFHVNFRMVFPISVEDTTGILIGLRLICRLLRVVRTF